jgi:hypothetical protein
MTQKLIQFAAINILLIIILINSISAENLYLYDSLKISLDVRGNFTLIPEKQDYEIKEISAKLLLYPKESDRQELLKIDAGNGQIKTDQIVYNWVNPEIKTNFFGYTAKIKTKNIQNEIKSKINFPIDGDLSGYEKYLIPTKTVDSDNQKIVAKANELSENQNDLFKVVFILATWVEENVKYDINTLTADASQKASWVLENKQGVCDEMTSLFVALCRSLGIPARFVSGISYTTSELIREKWQPHSWAEVYFPNIGWVSFDPAFGEYGYVDVTHLKLSEENDPSEPSTKFEWLAENVGLKSESLKFKVDLLDYGTETNENIQLESEILAKEVSFGSYNLIKCFIKNNADNYATTKLQLAVPKEVQIIGKNKQTVLMLPKEVSEVYWIIKVPTNLNSDFWYSFPVIIYSEKNISLREEFRAEKNSASYFLEEINQLLTPIEKKSYSKKVNLDCSYPTEIFPEEEFKAKCNLKNIGDTDLTNINFCLDDKCKIINLRTDQTESSEISLKTEKSGWSKVLISAENELIEKKKSLGYLVLDVPKIELNIKAPNETVYGQKFSIKIELKKDSLNNPKDIIITASGFGTENQWKIPELKDQEKIVLEFDGKTISWNNQLKFSLEWKDQKNKVYSNVREINFAGKSSDVKDLMMMFLNLIMKAFY